MALDELLCYVQGHTILLISYNQLIIAQIEGIVK